MVSPEVKERIHTLASLIRIDMRSTSILYYIVKKNIIIIQNGNKKRIRIHRSITIIQRVQSIVKIVLLPYCRDSGHRVNNAADSLTEHRSHPSKTVHDLM